MRLFGRKRYWERQRQTCDEQYRAGFRFGVFCFQQGCPRPALRPSDDDAEMSWRFGVQGGFRAAEEAAVEDADQAVTELAAEGIARFESMLANASGEEAA